MAKYTKRAQEIVADLMEDYNDINFTSGRGDKSSKVKNGKQGITNAPRDFRENEANVPDKRSKRKFYAR